MNHLGISKLRDWICPLKAPFSQDHDDKFLINVIKCIIYDQILEDAQSVACFMPCHDLTFLSPKIMLHCASMTFGLFIAIF